MATFNFRVSGLEVQYPENSRVVSFGGGYEFASRPKGPPQIQYRLMLSGFGWFTENDEGLIPTPARYAQQNLFGLQNFYETHELWKTFTLPTDHWGDLTVRFSSPLKIPPVPKGNRGIVPDFDVTVKLQP